MDICFAYAIAFTLTVTAIAFVSGYKKGADLRQESERTDTGTRCGTSRNAEKARRLMGAFLDRRAWVCRLNVCYSTREHMNEGYKRMWLKTIRTGIWEEQYKGYGQSTFIRLCHRLGCEVVLRQTGSIKSQEEAGFDQIVSVMSEEDERKGISLVYPHNKKEGDLL